MGLINQTNAQYYTGSEVIFSNTSVSVINSNLGVDLYDSINNTTNYQIFVDPTGSGSLNNYILFPNFIENGVGSGFSSTNFFVPANLQGTPGSYLISPTSANGTGLLLNMSVSNTGQLATVSVVNPGQDYTDGEVLTVAAGLLGVNSLQIQAVLSQSDLYTGTSYTCSTDGSNVITIAPFGIPGPTSGLPNAQIAVKVQLTQDSIWENYGSYEYIKLNDLIDNFIVGYTGEGKILENAKRSDILFHAKRGLQEFSYDTLRSVKSQELQLTPVCSAIIPQDYVNYVQLSWVDHSGVKHPIYPTTLTSSPTQPLIQDSDGIPTQDEFGENLEAGMSNTQIGWDNNINRNLNGLLTTQDINANIYNWTWWDSAWGQRYGQDQVVSNFNGWFNIDRRRNTFNFSSNLKDQTIILEYISDGLAYDEDTKVPKMAEEAMYMHIAYALVSTKTNVQEYIVRRYKQERRATLRNAKIRLSNIKLSEFIQVMRGKSKWIKH